MNEFTASNGIRVEYEEATDRVDFTDKTPTAPIWFGDGEFQALREFFQHERDEERGWWRSEKDPTWTAVRRNNVIYFHNEDHERSFHIVLGDKSSVMAWHVSLQDVAREYLKAHPEERKPWEDAKDGEIWAVTVGEGPEFVARVTVDGVPFPRFIDLSDDMSYGPRSGFTAARRIWPES